MGDLSDRMLAYEKVESGRRFMPLLPVLARLDGKSFSKWTAGLARPYDRRLSQLFISVTRELVRETQACLGYTQSDEINLVYYSDNHKSQIFFDGRVQKMTSVLASMVTYDFNMRKRRYLLANMPGWEDAPAYFDCRVWQVPTLVEAANYILSRELDATRNSVSMAAQQYYSAKQLHSKKVPEMMDMLMEKEINWNDYPAHFKRGAYVQKHTTKRKYTYGELIELPENHEARKNPDLEVVRKNVRFLNMPIFTKVTNRVGVIFNGEDPKTE